MCPSKATISAYYDEELDAAASADVLNHLSSCSECRDYLESYEGLTRELNVHFPQAAGSLLAQSKRHVTSRIMIAGTNRPWLGSLRIPTPLVAFAAALVVVLFIGLLITNQTPQPGLTADGGGDTTFDDLVKYLDSRQPARPVVFQLPQNTQLRLVSEPTFIRASEYRRVSE